MRFNSAIALTAGASYLFLTGGLRGVVWTDCAQLIFMIFAPLTVIAKVFIDMKASHWNVQPLTDFDIRKYMGNIALDFSHDETAWATFLGSAAISLYRIGLDQAVVQRCMASRTLAEAQRGCDPRLSGAIASYDQILPYYVKTYLIKFKGFTGIFLTSIVSAALSTTSSTINSQAAVLYVDILSPRFKILESNVRWTTRGIGSYANDEL
ncbi:hypothetical protein HPB52_011383 [Rhipicephalus sanguineus]|uniref:Uncharacterized protein n=1 Tax=Rhipicephalus sanguineus TaxID=34632 RepID=A0A9D4SPL6_RHISA|nr:hypothetical protein HPB52_011383 [Rhipicephalus sanguineus]